MSLGLIISHGLFIFNNKFNSEFNFDYNKLNLPNVESYLDGSPYVPAEEGCSGLTVSMSDSWGDGWNGNILTDSGGYQVFSLEGRRKISNDGVTFQSHLDGSYHHFTPESVIDIQRSIGSDFMMMLDVCPPGDANNDVWIDALKKTTRWAKQALKHYNSTEPKYGFNQLILPIIQGGTSSELRKRSAEELLELDTEAYAIGGLAVGETQKEMFETVKNIAHKMPENKPRYLMGVGTPSDILGAINEGIDMFDCVMPTSCLLYTSPSPRDRTRSRMPSSA